MRQGIKRTYFLYVLYAIQFNALPNGNYQDAQRCDYDTCGTRN